MEGGRIALGTCLAFPPPRGLAVMLISCVTVLNEKISAGATTPCAAGVECEHLVMKFIGPSIRGPFLVY